MRKDVSIHEIEGVRIIVVGNEAFDWGVDERDFKTARVKSRNDPALKENFLGSIEKHFVNCFSEFVGRQVTLKEINQALEQGWIECIHSTP
jgi:hypothetical protein